MSHNVLILHERLVYKRILIFTFLRWQVTVKGKVPQNDLMSDIEKEINGTDIGTSILSSEIDASSRQKDGSSGKVHEGNGPSITSYNEKYY